VVAQLDPIAPPRAVGARTVETLGAAEPRRLVAHRRPVAKEEGDEEAADS